MNWFKHWSKRHLFLKSTVFLATLASVIWLMGALPSSTLFWSVLNVRFAQDARYQLQSLFLPDRQVTYPLLIIGDSLFQETLPDTLVTEAKAKRITINGYDADDLGSILRALNDDSDKSKTAVCSLIVQVSPVFSVRARAFGTAQEVRLLQRFLRRESADDDVKVFFRVVQDWAKTEKTMPAIEQPADRPERMVGQARFADPSGENWQRAFSGLADYPGEVIGILDGRGTHWGEDSDLIDATKSSLNSLSGENRRFTWKGFGDLSEFPQPRCLEK